MTSTPNTPADVTKAEAAVADVQKVVTATQATIQHPNTWVANITTAVSAVVALIVLFHPGFKEPTAVQAAVSSAGMIGAVLTQVVHFATRRNAQTAVAVAKISK